MTLAGLAEMPQERARRMLGEDAGHTAALLHEAACHGILEAQTTLGQMLLDGRGTPASPEAARNWFTLAAHAGHPPAANMLGRCLERGWGGAPDLAGAASWYRFAAERSLDWGQYNLANMLLRGRGTQRDVAQSLRWFLAAAGQGHAKSMNLVGRFLEEGWTGPADPAAAARWYRRSAEGGDFRGQYNLATLLAREGRITEAARWFTEAGRHGSLDFCRVAADALIAQAHPELRGAGLAMAARCCHSGDGADLHRYGRALLDVPRAQPWAQPGAQPWAQPRLAQAVLQRAAALGHEPARLDLERTRSRRCPISVAPRQRRWLQPADVAKLFKRCLL